MKKAAKNNMSYKMLKRNKIAGNIRHADLNLRFKKVKIKKFGVRSKN
ncbi:MAG TPA: hypothetical protein PLD91_16240 [Spirochaetota bacterium]|nr:hypothetical protein [Spirochaetota bacterium]HQJ70215.1 hypothetical protein [Spirochaetota bacterium]